MTQPLYNNAELLEMVDKAEKDKLYYQDRYCKIKKERDHYKKKYHTAAKTIQRLKKEAGDLPATSEATKSPRNFTRNLTSINLSLADLSLKEICKKEKIDYRTYYILSLCYNHDFCTNNTIKKYYPWLWKSMKRIDRRIKDLSDKGYIKIIPAVKLGSRNSFVITAIGRIFVDSINKRLATKIKSDGKGINKRSPKEKDADFI